VSRLAVLVSGSGSNLQALIDACASGNLAAEIALVVSDRAEAGGLQRALAARIPAIYLPLRQRADPEARRIFEQRLAGVLSAFEPDLVVLAGWMLILSPWLLERFPGRLINLHPALLPDDGGPIVQTSRGPQPALRGAHAVRDALSGGVAVSGSTVHYVTAEPDRGPVILRREVPILPGDDESTLHARIKAVEHRLLPEAVGLALSRLSTASPIGRSAPVASESSSATESSLGPGRIRATPA
jgi:phosphoribosylglycinamide formyltransferase-1